MYALKNNVSPSGGLFVLVISTNAKYSHMVIHMKQLSYGLREHKVILSRMQPDIIAPTHKISPSSGLFMLTIRTTKKYSHMITHMKQLYPQCHLYECTNVKSIDNKNTQCPGNKKINKSQHKQLELQINPTRNSYVASHINSYVTLNLKPLCTHIITVDALFINYSRVSEISKSTFHFALNLNSRSDKRSRQNIHKEKLIKLQTSQSQSKLNFGAYKFTPSSDICNRAFSIVINYNKSTIDSENKSNSAKSIQCSVPETNRSDLFIIEKVKVHVALSNLTSKSKSEISKFYSSATKSGMSYSEYDSLDILEDTLLDSDSASSDYKESIDITQQKNPNINESQDISETFHNLSVESVTPTKTTDKDLDPPIQSNLIKSTKSQNPESRSSHKRKPESPHLIDTNPAKKQCNFLKMVSLASVVAAGETFVVDIIPDTEGVNQFTEAQGRAIGNSINKELFADEDFAQLHFEYSGLDRGRYRFVCADTKTRDWVTAKIPKLEGLWQGAALKVIQSGPPARLVRATVNVQLPTVDPNDFFVIIGTQNPTINTANWRLYSRNKASAGKQIWVIGVDEASIPALRELGCRPYCGMSRIKINLSSND